MFDSKITFKIQIFWQIDVNANAFNFLNLQIICSFDRIILLLDMLCESLKWDSLFFNEVLNNIFDWRFLIHSKSLYEQLKFSVLSITSIDNVFNDSKNRLLFMRLQRKNSVKRDKFVLKICHTDDFVKSDFFQNDEIEIKTLKRFNSFCCRNLWN